MAKAPKTYAMAPRLYTRYVPGQGRVFAESQEELDKLAPQTTAAPAGKRDALGAGFEAAKTGLGTGLPYAVQKATDSLYPEQEAQYRQQLQASAAKQEQLLPGGPAGFGQGASLGRIVGENLAYSAPQMGAQALGGAAGFAVGGPVGAGAGVGLVGAPMYVGSNVARATNEGQTALTGGQAARSFAASIPQAAVDVLGARFLPGVGKYLGEAGFTGNLLTRAAKGTAAGAITEGGGEALQQVGERYAAGLDLTGQEALGEYGQAAAIGGLLGGGFGAVGGATNTTKIKEQRAAAAAEAAAAGRPADLLNASQLDLQGGTYNEKAGPAARKSVNLTDNVRAHLNLGEDENVDEVVKSLQDQRRAIVSAAQDAQAKGDQASFYKLTDALAAHDNQYFKSSDPDIIAQRADLVQSVEDAQTAVASAEGRKGKRAAAKLAGATAELSRFDRTKNISPVQEYINAQQKEAARSTQADLLSNVGRMSTKPVDEQAGEGAQYDLFGAPPVPNTNESATAFVKTDMGGQLPTDVGGPVPLFQRRPTSIAISNYAQTFTLGNLTRNLRGADKLDAQALKFIKSLHENMTPLIRAGNVEGLQALIAKETEKKSQLTTVDKYIPILDRAKAVIQDYVNTLENARREETNVLAQEGAARAAPGVSFGANAALQDYQSANAIREQNAQATGEAVTQQAHAQQQAIEGARWQEQQVGLIKAHQDAIASLRKQAIASVISNPTTTNYHNAFQHALSVAKLNTEIAPAERAALDEAQEAQKNATAPKTAPTQTAPEFAEPERGPEENGVESFYAPPKPPKPEAPARPELKLSSYSDQDLQSLEAARNRRAARALREEPSTVVEPEQSELFTEKGNPTKAAAQKGVKSGRPKTAKSVVENLAKDIAENPDASRKDMVAMIAHAIELVQRDVPPADRLNSLQVFSNEYGEAMFKDAMELADKAQKAEAVAPEPVASETVDLNKVTAISTAFYKPTKEWIVDAMNANGDLIGEESGFKSKAEALAEKARREKALESGDQEGALKPFVEKKVEANATEKGEQPQGRKRQRQGTYEERTAPEASSSNRAEPVAKTEEVKYAAKMAIFEKARDAKGADEITPAQLQELGVYMEDVDVTAKQVQAKYDTFKKAAVVAERTAEPAPARRTSIETQKVELRADINKAARNLKNLPADQARTLLTEVDKATSVAGLKTIKADLDAQVKENIQGPAPKPVVTPAIKSAAETFAARRAAEKERMASVAPKKGQFQELAEKPVTIAGQDQPISPRVLTRFRQELDKLGLAHIGVRVLRQLEGRTEYGRDIGGHYNQTDQLITVVLQGNGEGFYTLSHEAIHALEDAGLILKGEKGAILNWAKNQPALKKFIEDKYGKQSPGVKASEYVAEAYAQWLKNKGETPTYIGKVFIKITNFLDAMRNFLTGNGFQSADDVFKSIYGGEFTNRKIGQSTLGEAPKGFFRESTAPQEYTKANANVREWVGGFGNQIAASMVIANKLTDMAVRAGIPAARKMERLLSEQGRVIARIDRKVEDLSERFDGLKSATERGIGEGSVNNVIQKIRFAQKWGFDPMYKDADGKKITVDVDPELNKLFNKLSPEAQQVVRDVFQLSRDNLFAKKEAVMRTIGSEYDALIKNVQDELSRATGDRAVKLTRELKALDGKKSRQLTRYNSLFKIDPNTPYAPIKRFGNFVVVGRSNAYLAAEQKAEREKTPEAYAELRKMQEDGEHYYVAYADDRWKAIQLRDKLAQVYDAPDMFRKDEASEAQLGGSEMYAAFQRMQKLIQEQGDSMDPQMRKSLTSLATDLYLSTLAESSSRKSEMAARLVEGGDFDMVRGAIAQGRSDARFIGSVEKNGDIADTLAQMNREAKGNRTNTDEARELVKQISARHAANLAPAPQNTFVDKLLGFTTAMYLTTSPMFFVQQAVQPFMVSMPVAAARHGYGRTMDALNKGYDVVRQAWGDSDITKPLDLNKLTGKMWALGQMLADSSALDVGIDKDMGNWTSEANGPVAAAMNTVSKKIGGWTRKLEAINRLSTGAMMFELEMAKQTGSNVDPEAYASYVEDFKKSFPEGATDEHPMLSEKEFAAAHEAIRIINETHGDYSLKSSPLIMRSGAGRVLSQFKKFQIMQLSLYTQAINDGFFAKDIPAAEKEIARRTLLYMTGHAALFAGALGLPGAAAGEWLWEFINKLMGREGPFTAEGDLRKAIGNPTIANLLINGAPTLAGVDLSGSLGQGNLLSIAPYADIPKDEDTYKDAIIRMAGPAIGGVGLDYAKALGFMNDGQYYKGLEKMLPKGFSNAVKAYRESTEGVTDKGGETTVGAKNIGIGATVATALGLRTTEVSNRQYRQGAAIETKQYFQDQTSVLKREYIKAYDKKDGTKMQELRVKWLDLQKSRDENGLNRQPISDLIREPMRLAKREKNVFGGVKVSKSNRAMAEQLAEETGFVEPEEE